MLVSICRRTNLAFQNCPSVKSHSHGTLCEFTNTINQPVVKHELTRAQKSVVVDIDGSFISCHSKLFYLP